MVEWENRFPTKAARAGCVVKASFVVVSLRINVEKMQQSSRKDGLLGLGKIAKVARFFHVFEKIINYKI